MESNEDRLTRTQSLAPAGELERIQHVLDEFQAKHQDTWHKFSLKIAEGLKLFETALERSESIGRFGWTIPYDATPRKIVNIIDSITDEASADFAFLEYFTGQDGHSLNALIDKTLANPDLAYWKGVLEEALPCVREKKYRVCIPALLTILDGFCAQRFAIPQFQVKRRRQQFLDVRRQQAIGSNSIERFAWLAFIGFVETVFQDVDFSSPIMQPVILNRHLILHGRDVPQAKLEDCLRLLLALGAISQLTPQGPPNYR